MTDYTLSNSIKAKDLENLDDIIGEIFKCLNQQPDNNNVTITLVADNHFQDEYQMLIQIRNK